MQVFITLQTHDLIVSRQKLNF